MKYQVEMKLSSIIIYDEAFCMWKGVSVFCFSISFQLEKQTKKKSDEKNPIIPNSLNKFLWHCKSQEDRVLILAIFGH